MLTNSNQTETREFEVNERDVDKGDFARIASIFNRKHHYTKTVSRSHVRLIVLRKVSRVSTLSKEVLEIAEKYFQHKEAFEKEILS